MSETDRKKEIEVIVSNWACPTQLDRIESMLQELLAHQNKPKRARNGSEEVTDTNYDFFWHHYPRKISKPTALNAWNRLNESQKQKVISVIPDWITAWRGTEKRFIPYPSTWLNQHRFDDDVDMAVPEEKVMPKTNKEWSDKAKELGIFARSGEPWSNFIERVKVEMR
jgi:hypothetical protein